MLREFPVAVRKSEAVTLRDPVMAVAVASLVDSSPQMVSSWERGPAFPPLPMDLHKHIVLARIFHGHVPDLDDLAPPERRDGFHGYTSCPSSRRASGS